jgi:CubicO group peptidase (beta-lactamase class C family)
MKFPKPHRGIILNTVFVLSFLVAAILPIHPGAALANTQATAETPPEDIPGVIDKYRTTIQEQMQAQRISGFAIALVDGDEVLWSEGFGCTDWSCKTPVTPDTPSGIQSMSKSFTAAAVLLAVQEGLLDLEAPVSRYLPDFRVNSLFDERPQDSITLRMLLSHTAGFTHEAPVGNNFDLEPGDWQSHIASISETWLKYPVGQQWSYSNLGIDLAGYILEKVSGVPFAEAVQTRLLTPLGMENSTFGIGEIAQMSPRMVGQNPLIQEVPLVTLMPSGGLYASANDMARYLQFYLNDGKVNDRQMLDSSLVTLMYQPQFQASVSENYGLGLGAAPGKYGSLKVNHGGAGFGFMSMMTWYPALDLGVVWLSNSTGHDLQNWLADAILEDVIATAPAVYLEKARAQPYSPPQVPETPASLSEFQLAQLVHNLAIPLDEEAQERWRSYAGTYGVPVWGRITELVDVTAGEMLVYGDQPLTEVKPGMFVSDSGEVLNFRSGEPTWRNIEIVKVDRSLKANTILLGACGLVFLSAPAWAIAGAVAATRQRRRSPGTPRPANAWVKWALPLALILAALFGLLSIAMLVKFPILLFGGVPFPSNPELDGLSRFGFSLPYAAAGFILLSAAGLALAWKQRLGSAWWRIWASVILGALVVVCVMVIL